MDPLAFITALAQDAGALLCERLDDPREVAEKRPHDLVTDADRASEDLIVRRIRDVFPRAAILGEESGPHAGSGDERFIVDPLDGTTNYAHRYPLFCVSIAYERAGVVEAGAVYAPVLRELFAARRGAGATRNGVPIRVSAIERVADAMVCTGFNPADYARNGPYFAHVSDRAQAVRRDGSAAIDLAFVAAGIYEAFWEWDLGAWDVAAGALLIEEAGGRVTAIEGGPFEIAAGSILASNARTHTELQAVLAEVPPGPEGSSGARR
ncbi:MAG: histidinol-phosphate phosphatase [Candidatus Eremiobacteraeota bacterium]|nr:histidinol-phosphate phosphatase [Candidatus Eremiobacteraeota bacterium]